MKKTLEEELEGIIDPPVDENEPYDPMPDDPPDIDLFYDIDAYLWGQTLMKKEEL